MSRKPECCNRLSRTLFYHMIPLFAQVYTAVPHFRLRSFTWGNYIYRKSTCPELMSCPEPMPSQVWDPQSWTTERTLSDHTGPVRCFAQCADRLLSGSDDGSVKVLHAVYTSRLLFLLCNRSITYCTTVEPYRRACCTINSSKRDYAILRRSAPLGQRRRQRQGVCDCTYCTQ